jgi:tRNA pseudouridine32 synthase/23S rRNA pseudouridine746 synthase
MKPPLPTVAGVGPSCQWLPPGRWKTILEFFQEQYPRIAVETWTMRMAKGEVIDECGQSIDLQTAYRVGACIFYYRELENERIIPFFEQVIYQDEHILVADKPHFLPVIPSGRFPPANVIGQIAKHLQLRKPGSHPSARSRNRRSGVVFRQPENKRPLHISLSKSEGDESI